MKKIIIITVLFLFLLSSVCLAIDPNQSLSVYSKSAYEVSTARDMVVIIYNAGVVKQYPTIITGLYDKLSQVQSKFNIIANQEIDTNFMEYLEDNNITGFDYIKRGDLSSFGKQYKYANVVILNFTQAHDRRGLDVFLIPWANNKIVSAEMQAKAVRCSDGKYLYRRDIVKEARSSTIFPFIPGNSPSIVNAWLDGVEQCTQQFADDLKDIEP